MNPRVSAGFSLLLLAFVLFGTFLCCQAQVQEPAPFTQIVGNVYLSSIGCFRDSNKTAPALPTLLQTNNANMTVELCSRLAAGYRYFGLQNGNQCYAGYDLVHATAGGEAKDCRVPCTGDTKEPCGGAAANRIFVRTVPFDYAMLGCYWKLCPGCTETRINTLWPASLSLILNSSNMTSMTCLAAAKRRGFRFFALFNGTDCYGTTNITKAVSPGNVPSYLQCNAFCSGDPNDNCGGTESIRINYIYPPVITPSPPPPLPPSPKAACSFCISFIVGSKPGYTNFSTPALNTTTSAALAAYATSVAPTTYQTAQPAVRNNFPNLSSSTWTQACSQGSQSDSDASCSQFGNMIGALRMFSAIGYGSFCGVYLKVESSCGCSYMSDLVVCD